jgi:pimeloyl-ACP methyl ester carboxylesterase
LDTCVCLLARGGAAAAPQGGWQNRARAAYAVEHALFKTSPIKHVAGISAPVLFCGAQRDALCPMAVIERAVAATPRAQLYAVDCNHFELFMPQVCACVCLLVAAGRY